MPRARLTLGLAVSLTGRYAPLGRQVRAGVAACVQEANAQGGPGIELLVLDDASDEAQLRRAVTRLVRESRVDLLLGPYGSGLTRAAAEIAEEHATVLWNHSGAADEIHAAGLRFVVGIIGPASRYFEGVLDALAGRDPGPRRVAICSTETGFGASVADGAARWVAAHGLTLACHERYPSGLADFGPLAARIAATGPDWLLAAGRVEDDLGLADALCAEPAPLAAAALVVAGIDAFRARYGAWSEGFLAPSQWEPAATRSVDCGPDAAAFAASYRKITDLPLDYPAAQGYAGALIALRCVELAGDRDQRALRAAASRLVCRTFYGDFALDAASGRQLGHTMLAVQWQDGARRVVYPESSAEARLRYPLRAGDRAAGGPTRPEVPPAPGITL